MKISNILILVFLLSALAIGSGWGDNDIVSLEEALDNVSITLQNITFSNASEDQYMDGMFTILEKVVHLVGVAYVEVMRMGVLFGNNNPEYFEPVFIIKIIKLLVWLAIISLLIQPLFYLIVFIIMAVIWIKDRINKRKKDIAQWED